jgi:hypothetical protein
VGTNQIAGTFEFILAPGYDSLFKAGVEQKFYIKANIDGVEYEIYDRMTFYLHDDGSSLGMGFDGFYDGQTQSNLILTIPLNSISETGQVLFSDQLDPAEGSVGYGSVEMVRFPEFQPIAVLADIEVGLFTFTELMVDENSGLVYGSKVAGEFAATLMPPKSYYSTVIMSRWCTGNELVDPTTHECLPMFSGYDLLAGFDSVYNGSTVRDEGDTIISYRGEAVEQIYKEGRCSSFDYGDYVVLQGDWKAGGGECFYREDCQAGCQQSCNNGYVCVQGTCKQTNQYSSCQSDDSCQSGEYCHPGSFVCLDKVYCVEGFCKVAKEIIWCENNQVCSSPEHCDPSYGLCIATEPRMLQLIFPKNLLKKEAVLQVGSQVSVVMFDGIEDSNGYIEPIGPIGGMNSGTLQIRNVREGSYGRIFSTLRGSLGLDSGRLNELDNCSPSNERCRYGLECYPVFGADNGICYTPCQSDADCYGRSCRELGFWGEARHKICVTVLDTFDTGCSEWERVYCKEGDECVGLSFEEQSSSICLTSCSLIVGDNCPSGQFCYMWDGSSSACFEEIEEGGICYTEDSWLNARWCGYENLCVKDYNEYNYHCRSDCTSDYYCPYGYTCKEFIWSNGEHRWACVPS